MDADTKVAAISGLRDGTVLGDPFVTPPPHTQHASFAVLPIFS